MKNHWKLFDCYKLTPFIFLVLSRDSWNMIIRQREETKCNVNKQFKKVLDKFCFCININGFCSLMPCKRSTILWKLKDSWETYPCNLWKHWIMGNFFTELLHAPLLHCARSNFVYNNWTIYWVKERYCCIWSGLYGEDNNRIKEH